MAAYDDKQNPLLPDILTYGADGFILLPYVNFHDVQCLALYSRSTRSRCRILPVRMEKISYSGRYGTLSLIYKQRTSGQ
ncbi:hypothetical protein NQ314_004119 [Rhamnusium bicolor]|uniref:Uncharacterized protein n=1 Tax=Rhamnusium bicolor TaxID=1586634 RepID=A0AAV8ZKB1_9CUCU|nr:hypothetical protein NQ314_004119 [Rhamnusium bicolor]